MGDRGRNSWASPPSDSASATPLVHPTTPLGEKRAKKKKSGAPMPASRPMNACAAAAYAKLAARRGELETMYGKGPAFDVAYQAEKEALVGAVALAKAKCDP